MGDRGRGSTGFGGVGCCSGRLVGGCVWAPLRGLEDWGFRIARGLDGGFVASCEGRNGF